MSATDLTTWQRLSPMALVFLIVNGGAKFIRENLYAFAGAGAGFAFMDRLGLREFLLGGAIALLAAILAAMVYYRRFRFRVEGDAIRVRRGLIENKDLRIRFARVQNVGLSQPFYFRPFGLVRFTLETPGAESTEVALPGVSHELALALRDRIGRTTGEVPPVESIDAADDDGAGDDSDATESDVVHAPGAGRLFRHGLVSNQVWLIAGLAASLFGTMWDRLEQWLESSRVMVLLQHVVDAGWVGAAGMFVGLVVCLFTLSGVLSLVRFHGFQLRMTEDRILSIGGLLDKREQNIRREKLTGLTVYQTALGRLLGQWYLVGKQASSKEFDIDPRGQQFMVPGLRRDDLGLVERLVPGQGAPDAYDAVSRRYRTFFWTRSSAVVLTAIGLAWWFVPDARLLFAAGLVVHLFVLWLIHRSWRCWGWRQAGDVCWVRQGIFGLREDAFELSLVQQAAVVRTPYFRRHGLATVHLVLPHGRIVIPFVPVEAAESLVNRALFEAETAQFHRV